MPAAVDEPSTTIMPGLVSLGVEARTPPPTLLGTGSSAHLQELSWSATSAHTISWMAMRAAMPDT
jgi:hypothetical protein